MSNEIPVWMVEQYKQNVIVLSQQRGSKLRETVRTDGNIVGERVHYDRVGSVEAQRSTSRHGDSPIMNTPHSRRSAVMYDYEWGDMVDSFDKLKTLNDPTNFYATSAIWALGRGLDDEVINALFGTAYSGKEGTTSVALPSAQKIDVDDHTYDSGTGNAGLTISKLILAKEILDLADVDPDYRRYCACTAKQISNLLATTEATSSDYNSVKALVEGKINTFLGFEFKRTNRMTLDTNSHRQVACYTEMALGVGIPEDYNVQIGPRPDKKFNPYVYAAASFGAVRVEDEQVVEIACAE
ncbi:phage capsid protein [Primorskyibacter sedentarius]|uniref:phage capsid protein n=1 Tax=Primorskyibacter sedentarius TaxID=745311 RepID=UPI003EBE6706